MASVSRWRDHPDRFVHRSALVGLARIRTEPDPAMLAELAECLLMPDDAGWRSPDTVLANAAHCTLGGRRAREVPLLAEAIMESIGACDLSHRPDDLAAWVIGQPSLFEI
ncbi:hypothetical protein [Actinoplanes sp. N902-109]|uniref:hypothetical protein n=1 Tax=Actinoplanes sp. (strain N902-109) TaxID=649831 RepID=UPI00032966BA|nr:hypothetical protein [Actinoplanes sp. N902-109]AGL15810.1 hypothetical protein L083_2300 [Actinoplanes sp. N902-109]